MEHGRSADQEYGLERARDLGHAQPDRGGQLGLSYIAYAAALRRATAMEAALVPMLEPILNPIWVLLFMGELPGPFAPAGGLVVRGAVAFRSVAAIRERPPADLPRKHNLPAATT